MAQHTSAYPEALQKAWAFQHAGNLVEAEREYRKLLRKQPASPDGLLGLGTLEAGRRNFAEARTLIERSLKINPSSSVAHCSYGVVLSELGEIELALKHYARAIELDSRNAEALVNMAIALGAQPDGQERALALHSAAIAINPALLPAHAHRSALLRAMKRWPEALEAITEALVRFPESSLLLLERARTLLATNALEAALLDVDAAARSQPGNVDVHNLRGIVLQKLERFDDALASFNLAQLIDTEHAASHWNEAICRLTKGDWSHTAWEKYEWGWKSGDRNPRRQFSQPIWTGKESLAGKTILLHDEQGLGDTIQFARFASLLATRDATVVLQVQPALKQILSELPGVSHIVTEEEPRPSCDFHCPLLSLPLALGITTDTIPSLQSPLRASATALEKWQARLTADPARPLRVGIAWSGSVTQGDNHKRSLPLAELLAIRPDGVEFVSLQKEAVTSDQEAINAFGIKHFGEELQDFSDTAALVAQMDLVISVCTSIAHLAASMHKPTGIVLAHQPCWRWLLHREDSPWYPTAKLYRQIVPGDWQVPLTRVQQDLLIFQDKQSSL